MYSWLNLRSYASRFLEELKKPMKIVSSDNSAPRLDMNPGPPEYKTATLKIRL
jgi:hypothetical protein